MNECIQSCLTSWFKYFLAAFLASYKEGTEDPENVKVEKVRFLSAGLDFKHQNHPRTRAYDHIAINVYMQY